MELNIESGVGVTPEQTPLVLQIKNSPIAGDCVVSEKRKMKDGKGNFDQYTLYGEDEFGVLRCVRFLMGKDLLPLIESFSKDTHQWEGQAIEVNFINELNKKDGKTYARVHFKTQGVEV